MRKRVFAAIFVLVCVDAISIPNLSTASDLPRPTCDPPEHPYLVLKTVAGSIEIELFPEAAPEAVKRLVRLVRGPVFESEVLRDGPRNKIVGYYDGLEFDEAYPHTSLATSARQPGDTILIRTQIDADALGLNERRIATAPEATSVWQFELYPYRAGIASDELLHPRMREWLKEWKVSFTADFLVGVSRKDINEALGLSYESGLKSRHVVRGSVSLEPFDAKWSTPRLMIALTDFPKFDGRHMVVGRVVSGLDLADSISARPLNPVRAVRNRPLVPVKISSASVVCRPAEQMNPANGVK